MLINALHEEISRVAIIEGDHLQELEIESAHKTQTKGNIYKASITKVEPSLQAAFVEYGSNRQGFLPLGEIHPSYWKKQYSDDHQKVNIQDVVERKQELLIQVVKEERGNKGAALTTCLSLAGRYMVLSPNSKRSGISRKLSDEDRKAMKRLMQELNVAEGMGIIIRTAGKDQSLEALQRDFSYLTNLWDEIRIKSEQAAAPSLIYMEADLATRAIRDHFTNDITEIQVDEQDLFHRLKHFVHTVLPGKEKIVKLYNHKIPMFRHYGIESQCELIHDREIRLPSGASIVFDPTEALTSIDVNSARATRARHIDDTALETNLEAAHEIARQLRIRDIGGLVVIDFIDMPSRKHAQQVEEALRDACKPDKARVQFARISRFGLLEMSRQRIHPSLHETTTEPCPRCAGHARIRTVESMALQMLTRLEEYASKGKSPTLMLQLPADTAAYLINHKRDHLSRIEAAYDIHIDLQIRNDLSIPHYRIEHHWLEDNQQRLAILEDTAKRLPLRTTRRLRNLKPLVGGPSKAQTVNSEVPSDEASNSKKKCSKGLLSCILSLFKRASSTDKDGKPKTEPSNSKSESEPRQKREQNRRRRPAKQQQNNDPKSTSDETAQPTESDEQTEKSNQRRRRRRRRSPRNKEQGEENPQKASDDTQVSDAKPAKDRAQNNSNEDDSSSEASKPRNTRNRRGRGRGRGRDRQDTEQNAQNHAEPDKATEPNKADTAKHESSKAAEPKKSDTAKHEPSKAAEPKKSDTAKHEPSKAAEPSKPETNSAPKLRKVETIKPNTPNDKQE